MAQAKITVSLRQTIKDYVGLVAPSVAVINGFIAVLVAQFYKDDPTARTVLVVGAGLLGAAAIGATFYSQYQIVLERTAEKARRTQIRRRLASFISDGSALMSQCADANAALPEEEGNAWADRVENFLLNACDASYVPRFRSGAGLSLNSSIPDKNRRELWGGICRRVMRLEQFSQEFSDQ